MRCLMCNREMESINSYKELLFREDVLCEKCRAEWERGEHFRFDALPAIADYTYNEAFSKCLIQFKECGDEALAPAFFYSKRNYYHWYYRGYTLVLLPSAKEKTEKRGFSHLEEMYSVFRLPMIEPFEKILNVEQKGQSKFERINIKKRIRLKEGVEIPRKIVLCDDVITTGSTMQACLNLINRENRKIKIHVCAIVKKHR